MLSVLVFITPFLCPFDGSKFDTIALTGRLVSWVAGVWLAGRSGFGEALAGELLLVITSGLVTNGALSTTTASDLAPDCDGSRLTLTT